MRKSSLHAIVEPERLVQPVESSGVFSSPVDIGSLDLLDYQTPFFIFDLDRVRLNYQLVKDALEGFEIFYAVKANAEVSILRALIDSGASFEVASFTELELLMSLGIEASSVLYSNPVKPLEQVAAAYAQGLDRFAFDSSSELEKIALAAPGARVYLRLHVDDRSSEFPLSAKFGAPPMEAIPLFKLAKELGLTPYGITFHVGSQATTLDVWDAAIRLCGTVIRDLDAAGLAVKWLNIGGGFPAQYSRPVPSMFDVGAAIQTSIEKYLPRQLALAAEPGRVVVADSGVLAATVIGREARHGQHWLHLEVGALNGMMEALQSRCTFPFLVLTSRVEETASFTPYTLTGPTCDSLDTLLHDVPLPSTMGIGDRVYIMSAGAYSISYGGSFNGFGTPAAYFANEGVDVSATPPSPPRRETNGAPSRGERHVSQVESRAPRDHERPLSGTKNLPLFRERQA